MMESHHGYGFCFNQLRVPISTLVDFVLIATFDFAALR